MANNPVHADRVYETTATTGTGTLDLAGTSTGFITFVAGVGDGEECSYVIVDPTTGDWETGFGVVTDAGTDTLSRVTVVNSSNAGSKVDFAAGTKNVYCSPSGRIFPEVGCQVHRTTTQSIPTASSTPISFDAEDYDPFGLHEGVTNPSRITIAIPGRYLITAALNFVAGAGTWRQLSLNVNGTAQCAQKHYTTAQRVLTISFIWELAANDYVELHFYHDAGVNLAVGAGTGRYLHAGLAVQRLTT